MDLWRAMTGKSTDDASAASSSRRGRPSLLTGALPASKVSPALKKSKNLKNDDGNLDLFLKPRGDDAFKLPPPLEDAQQQLEQVVVVAAGKDLKTSDEEESSSSESSQESEVVPTEALQNEVVPPEALEALEALESEVPPQEAFEALEALESEVPPQEALESEVAPPEVLQSEVAPLEALEALQSDVQEALEALRSEAAPLEALEALQSDVLEASQSAVTDESVGVDSVSDEPPKLSTGVLRWETVNIETIEKALELDAIRRLRLEHYNVFQILLSIRRRTVDVKGKIGRIAVLERESERIGDRPQRLYSGIGGLDVQTLPGPLQRELRAGVPEELCGVSVFHFSRALKYLCRHDIGLVEYDLENAVFALMPIFCERERERLRHQRVLRQSRGGPRYAAGVHTEPRRREANYEGHGQKTADLHRVRGVLPCLGDEGARLLFRARWPCGQLHQ